MSEKTVKDSVPVWTVPPADCAFVLKAKPLDDMARATIGLGYRRLYSVAAKLPERVGAEEHLKIAPRQPIALASSADADDAARTLEPTQLGIHKAAYNRPSMVNGTNSLIPGDERLLIFDPRCYPRCHEVSLTCQDHRRPAGFAMMSVADHSTVSAVENVLTTGATARPLP